MSEMTTNQSRDWRWWIGLPAVFLLCYFLPVGQPRFDQAVLEAFALVRWYAREHVILCLVPAFFIAGAISAFVQQASVLKYLGPGAPRWVAYGVASVSGAILAVCSCTVLPLFAGIWRMGAGLGPATAFLYSGPAINVMAVILTARILGLDLGIARAVGAVSFSVVLGLAMHGLFRREEQARAAEAAGLPEPTGGRPLHQTAWFFATMVGVLVFANWSGAEAVTGWSAWVAAWKWRLTGACAVLLAVVLVRWIGLPWRRVVAVAAVTTALAWLWPEHPQISFAVGSLGLAWMLARGEGEAREWFNATWALARQILPLLLAGVWIAGLLLGRPGHEGLIPEAWVTRWVGGNSPGANLFAAVVGAFMYFATLTEVPILQGLLGAGMGKGPALALLLAGPAVSLPNMLVLRSIFGTRRTVTYVGLVILLATLSGLVYGAWFQ
ncbi:hypothetical protein G4L39_08175 [Limisphaera ngatamarikiensis]|uniref:Permease n=1 Tax=Limisphaera ngatamarikiensis TaxID=1324935 RepID=A0A6M1RNY0_9BACT|nr:permease [Limisphaera ngatamarikiensis]NGO39373.1 hypothetical protein [Limisphaera ngatamarikiensis]